jgi:hypothetical protein
MVVWARFEVEITTSKFWRTSQKCSHLTLTSHKPLHGDEFKFRQWLNREACEYSTQQRHVFLAFEQELRLQTIDWNMMCNVQATVISRLSAQFFWRNPWLIFYYLNMSCKVICYKCILFVCLTFNVRMFTFHWNVSNGRRSSSYICPTSVWTSEPSNSLSMSRTMLCTTLQSL